MSQISMAVLVTAAVFIFFGALSLAAFRRYRRKHGYTMSYVTSLENGESDIRKDISEDSHKRMARR